MREWNSSLLDLFGAEPAARKQVDHLLELADSVQLRPLYARNRAALFERIAVLDASKRLFLLPICTDFIADPALELRRRFLAYVTELGGAELRDAVALLGPLGHTRQPEHEIRKAIEAFAEVLTTTTTDIQAPFRALTVLRVPLVGLAGMLALVQWCNLAGGGRTGLLRDELQQDRHAALRDRLNDWLLNGSPFLRCLVIRWIAETGVSTGLEHAVSTLRWRFERDEDSIVVAAAALGIARAEASRVRSDDPAADPVGLTRYLVRQYRLISTRNKRWREVNHLQTVNLGVLRAIRELALVSPDARTALLNILTTPSTLDIDTREVSSTERDVETWFHSILALYHSHARVAVTPNSTGTLGRADRIEGRLQLVDPDRVRERFPRDRRFWVVPVPSGQDPHSWKFQLQSPARVSPKLGILALVSAAPPTRDHRGDQTRALHVRAPWLLEGVVAALDLLGAGQDVEESERSALLNYILDVAIRVGEQPFTTGPRGDLEQVFNHVKKRIQDLVRSRLATEEFFELLRGTEPLGRGRSALLANLCRDAFSSPAGSAERAWIDRNTDVLRSIAYSGDYHLRTRATAALVLRFTEDGPTGALDPAMLLSPDQLHEGIAPALCFAREEIASQVAGSRPAGRTDARIAARALAAAAEMVARALKDGGERLDDVQSLAADCVASFGFRLKGEGPHVHLDIFSRRRLFEVYACNRSPLGGNLLRLQDWLLRTANAAETEYYAKLWRRVGRAVPAKSVYRHWIDRSAADPSGSRRRTVGAESLSPFDDRESTRVAARQELVYEAALLGPSFFDEYIALRFPNSRQPAGSRLLRVDATARSVPETGSSAVTASAFESYDPLLNRVTDLAPRCAYDLPGTSKVSVLASYLAIPDGTLDLHSINANPDEKGHILRRHVEQFERALVVGRIVAQEEGGSWAVDIGAGTQGVPRRHTIADALDLQADSAVVLELRRRGALVEKIFLEPLFGAVEAQAVELDIRTALDGPQRLKESWTEATRSGRPLLLRATVLSERLTRRASDTVRKYFLDPGLRIISGTNVFHPSLEIPVHERRLRIGSDIQVAVRFLRLARPTGPQVEVQRCMLDVVLPGEEVVGKLIPGVPNAYGARHWEVEVRRARYPIERNNITADLAELWRIDCLVEDDPRLDHLRRASVRLKVGTEGRLDVREASPMLNALDLTVAAAADLINKVVVTRASAMNALLEVALRHPTDELPLFGTLARVHEGDIRREDGSPLSFLEIEAGTCLTLEVKSGHHTPEGTFVYTHDQEDARSERALVVVEEDVRNVELRRLFTSGRQIDVLVGQGFRDLRVELPVQGPRPKVQIDPRNERHFNREPGSYVTAVVDGDWDPWAAPPVVFLAPPAEYSLDLDQKNPLPVLREIVQLDSGKPGGRLTLLNKLAFVAVRNAPTGITCFAGGIPLRIDPAYAYLVPLLVDRKAYRQYASKLGTHITRVEERHLRLGSLDEFPPLPRDHGTQAVIVAVPHPASSAASYVARWLPEHSTSTAAPEWPFESLQKLNLGDVLQIRDSGLFASRRTYHAAFMRQAVTPQALDPGAYTSILLRSPDPREAEPHWILGVAPAILLRVPDRQVSEAKILARARVLDRVDFRWGERDGDTRVLVFTGTVPGIFSADTVDLVLQVQKARKNGEYWCALRPPPHAQLPPLHLSLRHTEIPTPGVYNLRERLVRGGFDLPCALVDYRVLGVDAPEEGGGSGQLRYEPRLQVELGLPGAAMIRTEGTDLPGLETYLGDRDLRADVPARVVSVGATLAVVLLEATHENPIPLPAAEQSWTALATPVRPGPATIRCTLVRLEDGQVIASLRRTRPLDLATWLQRRRIARIDLVVREPVLHYVGQLRIQEARECRCVEEVSGFYEVDQLVPNMVLFEVAVGETFFATLDQLRFYGSAFDPAGLWRGDRIRWDPLESTCRHASLSIL